MIMFLKTSFVMQKDHANGNERITATFRPQHWLDWKKSGLYCIWKTGHQKIPSVGLLKMINSCYDQNR